MSADAPGRPSGNTGRGRGGGVAGASGFSERSWASICRAARSRGEAQGSAQDPAGNTVRRPPVAGLTMSRDWWGPSTEPETAVLGQQSMALGRPPVQAIWGLRTPGNMAAVRSVGAVGCHRATDL